MSSEKMGKAKEIGGLGFHDLEYFNVALFAKQVWRLIKNPDSLVARILKEKYHPNGTIMAAPLSRKRSYVWLIWIGNKSGDFSVRSTYHVAKDFRSKEKNGCSAVDELSLLWKKILRTQGPRVVRYFYGKHITIFSQLRRISGKGK